jgi:hypothetical protein
MIRLFEAKTKPDESKPHRKHRLVNSTYQFASLTLSQMHFSSYLATNTACHREACSSFGKIIIVYIEYIDLLSPKAANKQPIFLV